MAVHSTSTDRSVKLPTAIVTPTTSAQLALQVLLVLQVWTACQVVSALPASLVKMAVAEVAQAQVTTTALLALLDHLVPQDLQDLLVPPETKAPQVPQALLLELLRLDHQDQLVIPDPLELPANLDPREHQAKTPPQAKVLLDPKAQLDLPVHPDLPDLQEPLLVAHHPQDHPDLLAQLVATELLVLQVALDPKEDLEPLVTMPTTAHAPHEPDRRRTKWSTEPLCTSIVIAALFFSKNH